MARGQQGGTQDETQQAATQSGVQETAEETQMQAAETSANESAGARTGETQQTNEQQETQQTSTNEAALAGETRDWRNDRIDRLTAIRRQLERDLAAAKAQRGEGTQEQQQAASVPGMSEAELQAEVERRAASLAAQQEYNRRCNEVASAGQTKYGEAEFKGRIASLVSLVDGNDVGEVQAYHNMMMAALETGAAPDVLYELGSNLGEAQRILSLGPVAMGVALAKLAPQAGAASETRAGPSEAPRPVRPVTPGAGGARVVINPDDPERADTLTTAEWMRRRNEQMSRRQAS